MHKCSEMCTFMDCYLKNYSNQPKLKYLFIYILLLIQDKSVHVYDIYLFFLRVGSSKPIAKILLEPA